jgi:hypothetical protein
MKNANDTIGNRTRDLPACSAVPQTTTTPRAPFLVNMNINLLHEGHASLTSCQSFSWPRHHIVRSYRKFADIRVLFLSACNNSKRAVQVFMKFENVELFEIQTCCYTHNRTAYRRQSLFCNFLKNMAERHHGATRSAPFWHITRRRVVVGYRRFGTTYRSLEDGTDTYPEKSVNNYPHDVA